MEHEQARAFVERWLAAWNAHDLEGVLELFADDVVFSSPTAARLVEGSDGVVRGKAALREYWALGLRLIPGLRFEVESVSVGVETLVVTYRNQEGAVVDEVLIFDGPLVVEGHAAPVLGR